MLRVFYSTIQKIIEWLLNRFGEKTKIFMFHQVNDNKNMWVESNVCITTKKFQYFIDKLIQMGFQFYSLEHLNDCEGKKGVFLTFDDVFADAVDNAIPYLIEKQIPFCVFVSECYINQEGYLSKEQLEMLKKEPLCTIGYHSKNHTMIRQMKSIQASLELNCTELEERLQQPIKFLAFPYGSIYACGRKGVRLAKQMDYSFCFSTISAPCSTMCLRYFKHFLPRINVNEMNVEKILGGSQS